ncbi:unnamed protein product, partial [Ectocarpus sp. 12 AP-2014]
MPERVKRCHQEDVLVAAGTEADKFKEAYTISEIEKAKMLKKIKPGSLAAVVRETKSSSLAHSGARKGTAHLAVTWPAPGPWRTRAWRTW